MAETTRLVDYYYIQVAQKAGEGAKVLRALKDAGVNLVAFSGFPEGRKAQLDFIPADTAAFKSAAKANKWKLVGPKRGFLIRATTVSALSRISSGSWQTPESISSRLTLSAQMVVMLPVLSHRAT